MNFDAVADSIFLSFKAYCAQEVERRVQRAHDELMARLAEIPAGPQGPRGEPGPPGKDGRDGVDGKDGAPGRDGLDGVDGEDGRDGVDGKDGAPGPQGERGLPGINGQDGRDGRDGKDGAPGRDAAQIDVLEAIDATRSYPRGTFAKHAGGLVRAYRTTDPIDGDIQAAGWQVVVDGIAAVELAQVDERAFRQVVVLTSGKRVECVQRAPVMLYRGIWREGLYQHGDTVTYAGAMWHAGRDTTTRPGDAGSDWILAVKRGDKGKDGKDGERGLPGPKGEPGRDYRVGLQRI